MSSIPCCSPSNVWCCFLLSALIVTAAVKSIDCYAGGAAGGQRHGEGPTLDEYSARTDVRVTLDGFGGSSYGGAADGQQDELQPAAKPSLTSYIQSRQPEATVRTLGSSGFADLIAHQTASMLIN